MKMAHNGVINLLGGYIRAYCEDYRDEPEKLKHLLKTDSLVMSYITTENVDYIVRQNSKIGASKRRMYA